MSQVLEEIIEEVHALPPDERGQLREVLNNNQLLEGLLGLLFMAGVMHILSKMGDLDADERQRLRERLNRESHLLGAGTLTPEQQRRAALIRSLRGKYAHLPTSSDDFARQKAEETALEDRRVLL
jgi:hypothetical protein